MSHEDFEPQSTRDRSTRLPSVELLSAIYLLEGVKQFGPQKFKDVYRAGIGFEALADDPDLLLFGGKRGESFRQQLKTVTDEQRAEARSRAERQIHSAHSLGASIVTYHDPAYPSTVFASNNPVPALYVRGSLERLAEVRTVACVGSRQIREPYLSAQRSFAQTAAESGFAVVSGFATGADTVGHRGALDAGGTTICVMPGGLDRPFPPENKALWNHLLHEEAAVFVSEFLFGRGAEALTLRKRNKLIVAFSRGVLIGQSSRNGGSMNAYRFAREDKKPVGTFATDGSPDTSGNRQIEEECTLVDAVFAPGNSREKFGQWLSGLSS